jgi:hypothetical protein
VHSIACSKESFGVRDKRQHDKLRDECCELENRIGVGLGIRGNLESQNENMERYRDIAGCKDHGSMRYGVKE